MTPRARVCLVVLVALFAARPALAQLQTPKGISLEAVTAKWTGDLDGMVQRHMIRVLTPYSRTHYFIDKGVQHGLVYDAALRWRKCKSATRRRKPSRSSGSCKRSAQRGEAERRRQATAARRRTALRPEARSEAKPSAGARRRPPVAVRR